MDAERYFKEASLRGKLHHTLLVEGGDDKTVLFLSRLILCGGCEKKLEEFNDLVRISPSGSSIKISQIRELEQIISLKPFSSKWRLVVIEEADRLTPEAANALLKILEEPPESTYFLLLTMIPSALPHTILSRTIHLIWEGKEKKRVKKLSSPEKIKKREDLRIYIENMIYLLRDWEAWKSGTDPIFFPVSELQKISMMEERVPEIFDAFVKIYSVADRANLSIARAYIKEILGEMGIGKL